MSFQKPRLAAVGSRHIAEAARLDLFHPVEELVTFTLANDLSKCLSKGMQRCEFSALLAEFSEIISFLGFEVLVRANKKPDRLLSGKTINHPRYGKRPCLLM